MTIKKLRKDNNMTQEERKYKIMKKYPEIEVYFYDSY